jgi:hypothetical protein
MRLHVIVSSKFESIAEKQAGRMRVVIRGSEPGEVDLGETRKSPGFLDAY